MKSTPYLLLLFLILCLPILSMVACNGTPDTPDRPIDPVTPDEPGGSVKPDDPIAPDSGGDSITLVGDGVAYYRVIRSDFSNAYVTGLAGNVRSAIGMVTGVKPDIKTDWDDQKDNAHIKEILIGKTNRIESTEAIKSLAPMEYTVRAVGNKIVIAGATDELLARAVDVFLREYVGYRGEKDYTPATSLSLPCSLSLTDTYSRTQSITLYVTDESLTYVDALQKALVGVGESLTVKTFADDPATVFDTNNAGIVLIAGADHMPATAAPAIKKYLNNDGRIVMLGGPAFETTLLEIDGEWLTYDECLHRATNSGKRAVILDTSTKATEKKLSRLTNDNAAGYRWSIGDYGLENSEGQLFHEVDNLSNWDTFRLNLNYPKGDYSTLTLYAKPGDDHTTGFYIELHEKGGVRWTAGIRFTSDDWAHFILTPADFTWFNGGAATDKKVPDFNNIEMLQVGFAGQAAVQTAGHHSYYIADVAFCTPSFTLPEIETLTLDAVAPLYEQYPVTNASHIETYDNQVFVKDRDYVLPSELISCNPGRQGLGFENGRTSRFVPLLRVTDEKGLHSGYAAWMHIYSSTTDKNGQMEGAIVAYFSAVSDDFYDANGIAAIRDVVEVMTRNAFLVEGGTDEFIYVEEDTEQIKAGVAYVVTDGTDTSGLVAGVALYQGDTLLKEYTTASFAPLSGKNNILTLNGAYDIAGGKPDRAVATLTLNGEVIDRVEHEVKFWTAKPESERSYVYIEDGMYMKDGKPITFFGVNYMPSSGMAEADGALFEHYVSAAAYDPDVYANDLARIKEIGMNAISIFIHSASLDSNNVLHLVDMAEEMGIYVDLAIRGYAYPLKNYSADMVEQFIHQYHFEENDNIIAYDIAWEERLGTYEGHYSTDYNRYVGRDIWDADFTEWVKLNYGSKANAEAAWGTTLPTNGNGTYRVDDAVLKGENPRYTKAIAAYYRFLDEQVAAKMNDAVLEMKAMAPNQLFSFRLSWAGSTWSNDPTEGLFDYQSLAPVLDFLSPEGYALGAGEDRAMQVVFANAYARYVQPDSPVVWKEFGKSCWSGSDDGNFNPSASALKASADYYRYTLEYCLKSYTSGMYAWFYAGGFRIGENSDYGIVNPDGSDREITTLLREYAPKFINQGARPETDVLLTVERDDHIKTIYGMYRAIKDEMFAAVRADKFVDLVHAEQSGFADFPYADEVYTESVGDTEKTGTYPLRYVNGMVKSLEYYTEDGKTHAKVVVCNTKQSVWRAGTVSLVSTDTSDIEVDVVIDKEVDYLEEIELTFPISGIGALDLRFEIEGVQFGPLYTDNVTTIR